MRSTSILAGALVLSVAACSTAVEEREAELFAPVYPTEDVTREAVLPSGGIYSAATGGLFATDRRATQIGDILTVDFAERFAASKSQAAATSKSDSFAIDLPDAIIGNFDETSLNAGTTRAFNGNGNATQSNSLTGRMSVSVVRVLAGGNLEIQGQKKLTLNNGHEYVRVRGVVRPSDISSDNVVRSDRIANAEIKYVGAGDIADSGKQGWMRRALNTVSPF